MNALAYFSGTSLYDERTGQWFYHDHKDVAQVELLLPQDAPLWAKGLKENISSDRTQGIRQLSGLAEQAEKRKNSQVYREFEFALPKELTNVQNTALAREFLRDQVCGRGMAVVMNLHLEKDPHTGESRPHCHGLMMTRRLAEEGFGKKERDWNKKDFLLTLREQLTAYTNFHLKLHGHDIRIDHRSYEERGIDIESQHTKTLHERSGFHAQTRAEIRHQYEITRQRNVARLIKRPETVFDIVTSQQSTFMWGDVEKVLARYVREEAIFDSLNQKLQNSRQLVLLREEERLTPAEASENASVYTTQSMLAQELSLVHLAEKLGDQQSHETREEDVKAAINRANAEFASQGSSLSSDQTEALRHITKGDQLSCLVGYAGAGKSTTFKAAKEVWEASGYKVYGLAPTGRAAQNLEEIGLSSQTLHKFLKDYENGRSQYHENSVLVLDEAGMVDVRRFNDLLQAVDHLGVKLVISGDGAQAQPIEAGPGFRLVTDRLTVTKIETIVRQKADWQQEATRLFGTYHTREALQMYVDKGHVQFVEEKVPDLKSLVSQERPQEIVELYNLSRRLAGNIWQSIFHDLKEQGISQDQVLKTAPSHPDFALFKHWQETRNQTAVHMKDHLDTYREVMTSKGVDPVAFAALFVNKDLSPEERQQDIRKLVKEWKLETPDPLSPLHICDLRRQTRQEMVQAWSESLKAHPGQSHLMVTYTNRDTHLLNEDARHLMRRQGVMDVAEYFHTVKRESRDDFGKTVIQEEKKAFSKGERLVFTRNDRGLQVKNGTLGTIEDIDSQKIKVRLDGDDRVVSFASNLYPYFDRGWAITIIKSQGSTADHVFKLATFEEDRNLAYVGMTRHRASLQVFGSTLDFWKEEVFAERLSRSREKLSSLDYLSPEEAQSRIKPPARLMEEFSSLGGRLESWGYYSRKGWESVCERFLGKSRPEETILFAQSSVEESLRAKEMGIHQAFAGGGVSLSNEIVQRAEQRGQIAQERGQNAEQSRQSVSAVVRSSPINTLSPAAARGMEGYSEGSGQDSQKALALPSDVSVFVDKQAAMDAAQKHLVSATDKPTPDVIQQDQERRSKRSSRISLSKDPYYSLTEVRQRLTPDSIENICTRLLGDPHREMSNRRHLRYGASGALAVSLSSSSPGLWKDHSRDEGGDIFKLVQRERGGDFKEALAWVAEALQITSETSLHEGSSVSKTSSRARDNNNNAWRVNTLNRYLKGCRPIEGTLAQRYLREHRGIQEKLPSDLRFIAAAWNEQAQQSSPALAAIARDREGTVTGLQVIFLNDKTGEKADCAVRKKSFGILRGSSVRIQKGEGAVFLAEGIETALSLREAGVRGDIYAVLGVSNFKNAALFMEDKTRPVILCADQDGAESPSHKIVEKAVSSLKDQGFAVSVMRPESTQGREDFNDVLKREGIQGVRAYFKGYVDPRLKMSERDQRIFSYLEKAITEDPYTRPKAKEDYLHRAVTSPEKMLHFWQRLTRDRSFMPDGDPRSPEQLAAIERYQEKMAVEREQMRQERMQKETGQTSSLPQPSSVIPPVVETIPAGTDLRMQESSPKIESILANETFKKVEASVPSSLQEGIEKGQNKLAAQEESLKLDTDVQKFIQVFDRACDISALNSGESKTLWPVLDDMIASWKEDERFEQRLAASGHRKAAQYVEQYHIQQKRLQERTQGYALEI